MPSEHGHNSTFMMTTNFLERIVGSFGSEAKAKETIFNGGHDQHRKVTDANGPLKLALLQPGQVFHGHQESEKQKYKVKVEVKDVNLEDSAFSGYLTIENLTTENPSLTTFFESEVIGPKYSFITRKWESTLENDVKHWSKFPYWQNRYLKFIDDETVRADPFHDEYIFMRWKELFLVPDYHVKSIPGASYSGFYYTCMKVDTGTIDGYYYHSHSELYNLFFRYEADRESWSACFEYR